MNVHVLLVVLTLSLGFASCRDSEARPRTNEPANGPARPPDLGDRAAATWDEFVASPRRGLASLDDRLVELKAEAKSAGHHSAAEIDDISRKLGDRTAALRAKLAGATEDAKASISEAYAALK